VRRSFGSSEAKLRARHAAARHISVGATNNATASGVVPAPESINMLRRSLQDSETRLQSALDVVDMDKQMAELGDLQQQSESGELWNDPANARAVVQVRSRSRADMHDSQRCCVSPSLLVCKRADARQAPPAAGYDH
jgi:hypothetical protein